jgi:ABC-2 type transport system permease protein
MRNVMVIARKEYVDLCSNVVILLVLLVYFTLIINNILIFGKVLNSDGKSVQFIFNQNLGFAAANDIFNTLTWVNTLVGVIIGCAMISSERHGNAINTLITKPLYRDTIINGKIIGSLLFLATIQALVIALYTACYLVLYGNAIAPYFVDYLSRLPFIFFIAMIYVSIFLCTSMLISLIVRDQAFAMVLSVVAVYVSEIMWHKDVAANIDSLFPGNGLGSLFINISPRGILNQIRPVFFEYSCGAFDAFQHIIPDLVKFLIFVAIALVSSYIIFIRRDLS